MFFMTKNWKDLHFGAKPAIYLFFLDLYKAVLWNCRNAFRFQHRIGSGSNVKWNTNVKKEANFLENNGASNTE
jgi:hypothetical protein